MAWQALLCATGLMLTVPAMALADAAHFDIAAQPLPAALKAFAAQAHMQLLYQYKAVEKANGNAVSGELEKHAALDQLLRNSGLEAVYSSESAATIRPIKAPVANLRCDDPEAGKAASQEPPGDRLRLAQVDQGQAAGNAAVENEVQRASQKKPDQIEEVVVTGSRIPLAAKEGGQKINVYTQEQIEHSGQTTLPDFLGTLPEVSTSASLTGSMLSNTFSGGTTVQLHGLPIGTTLVLINGRRVETSGSQYSQDFFDLGNIPLTAVDRIEVVPQGSSAVYGSDAIAGVVNIILRKDFTGAEAVAKYGFASRTDEWTSDVAWGKQWTDGSVSLMGGFQTQSGLNGTQRSLTANEDFTRFGGSDVRSFDCNPGNVFSASGNALPGLGTATYAAVPVGFSGTPTLREFSGTAGTLNKCSNLANYSLIPPSRREAFVAQGDYNLAPAAALFGELLVSRVQLFNETPSPELFGQPGFTSFTVSPSNPFNPFGETVGVSGQLAALGRGTQTMNTVFVRPVLGVRGTISSDWKWEIAGWDSQDRSNVVFTNFANAAAIQDALNSADPTTALNPFVAGPQGSPVLLKSLVYSARQILSSQTLAANGFVQGTLLQLPAGPLDVVFGSEYDHDRLSIHNFDFDFIGEDARQSYARHRYAFFSETRIPILRSDRDSLASESLVATIAARYDHYGDFGGKTTPQYALEWRPLQSLLLRASYGKSFKAPPLFDVNSPLALIPGAQVVDPLRGGRLETVIEGVGGNPNLNPETGQSRAFGLVYSSSMLPDLQVAVTRWSIDQRDTIQELQIQSVVDNENLFPSNVIRASSCSGGPPCPITQVNVDFVNFGDISLAGWDYKISYKVHTALGEFAPTISATEVYRYSVALTPQTPPTNSAGVARDNGDWAPKWKGTASLVWKHGPYSASIDGRYVGRYQDYDSARQIGNFWLSDANFRWAAGEQFAASAALLKGSYVEIGGVNIFNRLPQFSNYLFGLVGYDPAEGDIRGRFLYASVATRF